MNQYICILEKRSLRLAKEITAHSSIPDKFFFPLWKCIMVKLSLIEEKITDAPKSRPHGNLITCGPADATLFTRQRSLQSRPAAHWRSILIHSSTESRIEGALSLEGFFPLTPPPWRVNQGAGVQTPGLTTTVDTELCHGCRLTARWNLTPPHEANPLISYSNSVCLQCACVVSRNRILLERHGWKMLNLLNLWCASSSHSV